MNINTQLLNYVVSEESFPDKAFIIKEGNYGDWIYVILEGRVKVKKQTSGGMLTIDTLTKGNFIGEDALLKKSNRARIVSAVADGPVLVGTLDRVQLSKEWEAQPCRIKNFISNLLQNIEEATQKSVNLFGTF
jgi:CRP-like cAMP-binding protein